MAIPVAVFALTLTFRHAFMVGPDPLHLWLSAVVLALAGASIALAALGVTVTLCLVLIMLGPAVTIVVDELVGHRHRAAAWPGSGRPTVPERSWLVRS
ncbi:hypothetical protein ACQCSX_13010 [Pseudarthrobacter sp. P1]|uniref:hypothetical protein n=1 Tax=Pseudarthrobacter sp. P1 TaxID=3418418 RepID=UPI003CEAB276